MGARKRKSKDLGQEVLKAQNILAEKSQVLNSVIEEEKSQLEEVRGEIYSIEEKQGMYIGVVLRKQDILKLSEMLMDGEKEIILPFNVYFASDLFSDEDYEKIITSRKESKGEESILKQKN